MLDQKWFLYVPKMSFQHLNLNSKQQHFSIELKNSSKILPSRISLDSTSGVFATDDFLAIFVVNFQLRQLFKNCLLSFD